MKGKHKVPSSLFSSCTLLGTILFSTFRMLIEVVNLDVGLGVKKGYVLRPSLPSSHNKEGFDFPFVSVICVHHSPEKMGDFGLR